MAPTMEKTDLRGLMPEGWLCVDCGINTAPGMFNRAELEKAIEAAKGRRQVDRRGRHRANHRPSVRGLYRARGCVGAGGHGADGRWPLHWLPGKAPRPSLEAERLQTQSSIRPSARHRTTAGSAEAMNVGRGLFRARILLTVLWLIGVGLLHYDSIGCSRR